MGRHSSDSNSREKNRNRNRYYNHKYRSSSSSSSESSRHSRRHQSKISESRYHKKSKYRRRSSSSSDYSSSKYKRSSYSHRKESYSKKKYRKRSSSSSSRSTISSKSHKNNHSSKASSYEKNNSPVLQVSQLPDIIEENISIQKNIDDVIEKENAIKQIQQEGFVFKIFKPLSDHKEQSSEDNDNNDFNVPKLNQELVQSLSVEDSTFLISNRDRLLNARYKLLTKQERCNNWAKSLFTSYKESQNKNGHLD